MTPAERKALDALHVWLHHPCGDDVLIEASADFHNERSAGDCEVAEFEVELDVGPELVRPSATNVVPLRRGGS